MGKTYRNRDANGKSDSRNSRSAKNHSKMKQKEGGVRRMRNKEEFWNDTEG